MKEDTTNLIRIFHTVATRQGLTPDDKQAIYASYGVTSSKQLNRRQLQTIIASIEGDAHKWRRRLMAAIGNWLDENKIEGNSHKIKAIACRAAKADKFNNIPVPKLRKLYNQFISKDGTVGGTATFAQQITNFLQTMP